MTDNNTGNNIAFDAIKIGMASPEQIREWSYGEVKKPEMCIRDRPRQEAGAAFLQLIQKNSRIDHPTV